MKTVINISSKLTARLVAAAVVVVSSLFASGCKNCAEPVKEPGCYEVTYQDFVFGSPPSTMTRTVCTADNKDGIPVLFIEDCEKVLHYERTGPIETTPFPPDSSLCLQDDADPSKVLMLNFSKGNYLWCCGLTTKFSGDASIIITENSLTFKGTTNDGSFEATINRVDPFGGVATLKSATGQVLCSITDTFYLSNDCPPCKP
jgi:hypothetical protein